MGARVLVTGSRDWDDVHKVKMALEPYQGGTLVTGACPTGADAIAERHWRGVIERHPAQWGVYGRYAGPKRNREMVESKPDVVLAFSRNQSRGTEGTIQMAKEAGLRVEVYRSEDN